MDAKLESLFGEHLAEVTRRADEALQASRFDGLVVLAGLPPTQFGDDQPYPFKPNPQFKLWVPEPQPGCIVAYQPGNRPRLIFLRQADFWHQPPEVPVAPWAKRFDVEVVPDARSARRAARVERGHALLGEHDPAWDVPGSWNPPDLLAVLDFERAAKTPYEIECLARASRLGAIAHRAAERAFRDGASEYEVHLAYCQAAALREEELPYNSIIAFDRHAAVLHYQHLERTRREPPESLLIDAGAPFAGYASDITRTYAARPGGFAELIAAMDGLQRELAATVRIGRDFREIHLDAHRGIGRILQQSGLARASAEEAVERGLTQVFFPHGVGHLLGLQVHDVGGLMAGPRAGSERPRPEGHPWLRLTRDLPTGCAVTVEPGLYFIDSLLAQAAADRRRALIDWRAVDALKGCGGIRIEDNVVALHHGPRNLTREAFAAAG